MKKILVIVLLIVALPLYGYNAFLLLKMVFAGKNAASVTKTDETDRSYEELLLAATPVSFKVKGRDPFTLYKEKPAVSPPVGTPVVNKAKERAAARAPEITITGIMWNPDNPVAMIKLPGGSTKCAKAGQQLGDNLTLKRIEKKSVVVVYEGKEFVIGRK